MYINMTILMTMNIYITKDNEGNLRKLDDWTMSGLVNYLLRQWFSDPLKSPERMVEKIQKPFHERFPDAPKVPNGELNIVTLSDEPDEEPVGEWDHLVADSVPGQAYDPETHVTYRIRRKNGKIVDATEIV